MHVEKQTAFRFAWLVAVVSLSAGCSTMNADECRAANWSGLGYADASKGKDVSMAGDRAQACSEHGYRMDMAAYQRGWNEGLREFCTFPGGQAFGDRGGNYKPGYCPPGAESQFLASYLPAYKRYQYQQRIDGLQRDINRKNSEIIRLQSKKDSSDDGKISRLKGEVSALNSQLQSERMRQSMDR
ncbi:MAG: DUF2799 domain-containing protein [Comamonas sp.]|jgi:hypothetical protein|uniref:DUF2799 domain-containing protein n=1 Tax=Comamonas sp. TaxID=34028 RepID=UPI0028355958|nr:DUF2799 domain-containing protein [Comamonas sp.]MDR0216064.1 DUF2799 domain-containing protein [Comamonas sp.]